MKYKKVLIAIDDSPLSDKVVTEGYGLCRQLGAEIAFLSVIDTTLNMTEGNVTPAELTAIIRNDFRQLHNRFIKKLNATTVTSFVEEGHPSQAIIETAKEWDADAIVIGTHGRTGLKHLLMGSVAEKVLRHWTKPCFIIPANR